MKENLYFITASVKQINMTSCHVIICKNESSGHISIDLKKKQTPFIYINYKKAQTGSPKSTLKMSCTAYITFNRFTIVYFIVANRSCNTRSKTSTPSCLKLLIKEQNIGNIVLTALWGQQSQDDRLRDLCNIWDTWFRTRD